MMRRLLINSFSFAVGVMIAVAVFLPSYSQAGSSVLTGQNSGISSGRFSAGGGNPSTTYSVGETTIRDVTATGTDVTISRETPFTAKNRFGDKATGRIIDAVKVEAPALRNTMFGFVKGGLMNVGLTILAGYAIEKGWEWMASAQCQVTPECYVKSQFNDVPFSPTNDMKICDWNSANCFVVPNSNFTSGNQYRSVNEKVAEICKKHGLISKTTDNARCYAWPSYNSYWLKYSGAARPAGSTVKREQTAVSDPEIDAFTNEMTNNHPLDSVRDYTNSGKSVPYSDLGQTRLAEPMETTPRQLTTSTVQNPDGSIDTNTSIGKTVITISPTGEITMTDVTTGTSTHTTPDGVTTTGPTTITETTNEAEPEQQQQEQPELPADPEMPTVPELYKQKYKDGLKGVWDAKKQAFMNSEFIQSIKSLAPDGLDSGTCPQWSLGFDMGVANYGEQSLPFPCWLAPFLKAVMMLTAAFTARKIIWG